MSPVALSPAPSTVAPPAPFLCCWKRVGFGGAWLHLRGELDLSTVDLFTQTLKEAQANARTVSIDLQELAFIDCSALQAIVDAHRHALRVGHTLIMIRGSGQVDRVLELTGLLERVAVVDVEQVPFSA